MVIAMHLYLPSLIVTRLPEAYSDCVIKPVLRSVAPRQARKV